MMRTFTVAALLLIAAVPQTAPPVPGITWQAQTSGVAARLRGVSAVSSRVAWASGGSGTVLRTVDGGGTWEPRPVPEAAALDFRDIDAFSDRVAYTLSIGQGAASRIYKTADGGAHWDRQFATEDPNVFLDAMTFQDPERGFAFGDSADGRLFILRTSNGGRTWDRIPPETLPAALPKEGAFASSGTNVAVIGRGRVWIGTTAARILRSTDAGRTWQVSTAPLATSPSAGIFSIAFRDAAHGVVVGGDYAKEPLAIDNAATSSDGGVTWTLVKDHGLSGYRSVVAWVPGTRSAFLAIGPSGADWSADDGRTWTALPSDGFDTLSFAKGGTTGWAAGARGRISKLTIR